MTINRYGITVEDVARKAVELARANPEHIYQPPMDSDGVYPGCLYVHRNENSGEAVEGGCLFGRALLDLGVPAYAIPEGSHIASTLHSLGITEETVHRASIFDNGKLTGPDLLVAMVRSQSDQDAKRPWGEAITHVEAALVSEAVPA